MVATSPSAKTMRPSSNSKTCKLQPLPFPIILEGDIDGVRSNTTGTFRFPGGFEVMMLGDHARVLVALAEPVTLARRSRFSMQESGRIIGVGVVQSTEE